MFIINESKADYNIKVIKDTYLTLSFDELSECRPIDKEKIVLFNKKSELLYYGIYHEFANVVTIFDEYNRDISELQFINYMWSTLSPKKIFII